MVNGITAAIKLTDPPKIGIRTRNRMLEYRDRRPVRIRRRQRQLRKEIDVPCASQMLTANTEVTQSHGVIVAKLPLQVETPLMRQRLDIIRRERINVNRATDSSW